MSIFHSSLISRIDVLINFISDACILRLSFLLSVHVSRLYMKMRGKYVLERCQFGRCFWYPIKDFVLGGVWGGGVPISVLYQFWQVCMCLFDVIVIDSWYSALIYQFTAGQPDATRLGVTTDAELCEFVRGTSQAALHPGSDNCWRLWWVCPVESCARRDLQVLPARQTCPLEDWRQLSVPQSQWWDQPSSAGKLTS